MHTAATRLGCKRAWVSQLLHWLYKQTYKCYSHIVGGSFLATKAARVLSRYLSTKIIAFIVCKYTWHVGNRPFPLRHNGMQLYVTSRLGCLRWPAGANFTMLYTGTWPTFRWLLLHVEGKYRAVLAPIQSSSINLFNSSRSNSVRLCLTLDRAVGYHQVHGGYGGYYERSCRAS